MKKPICLPGSVHMVQGTSDLLAETTLLFLKQKSITHNNSVIQGSAISKCAQYLQGIQINSGLRKPV